MDFEFAAEHESFRKEFRDWLSTNLPPDLCLDDASDDRVASDRETFERRRAWQRTMHAAGWVGTTWPKEYGGRDAGLIERVIWDEEYTAARAPVLPGNMGLNLVGPTLIHWGTEAQKRRHLPAILNADEIWCQGFSEPGAGSDLASLRTRAVDRGEHFVVNGQKVWTSGAHFAHWIILLVRTNPDVPKHQGISCLLVPMTAPGVTVRPLVLLTGHHHFNEVFFTDVVVPKANLLGPVNQGWKVSTTTLMYERHSAGGRSHTAQIARLIALARRVSIDGRPAWDHPWIRQRLAQLAIDSEALKYTRLRSLTRQLRGEPPGPEGSVLKLSGSELGVRIADVAGQLLGMHVLVNQGSEAVPDAPRWFNRVLAARQYTISAGTSEIQRNIIGERVLGLPRG
jgi:alkylation response protein AidB-like acyl-CoA dehydrogenase